MFFFGYGYVKSDNIESCDSTNYSIIWKSTKYSTLTAIIADANSSFLDICANTKNIEDFYVKNNDYCSNDSVKECFLKNKQLILSILASFPQNQQNEIIGDVNNGRISILLKCFVNNMGTLQRADITFSYTEQLFFNNTSIIGIYESLSKIKYPKFMDVDNNYRIITIPITNKKIKEYIINKNQK